jgi:hypothetical protein
VVVLMAGAQLPSTELDGGLVLRNTSGATYQASTKLVSVVMLCGMITALCACAGTNCINSMSMACYHMSAALDCCFACSPAGRPLLALHVWNVWYALRCMACFRDSISAPMLAGAPTASLC